MMKRIFTFLILWICASSIYAQVETRGSDFWVTFGNNANGPSSQVYLQLRIVTKQAVTGKITFTETNQVVPFSIPANSTYNHTLSAAEKAASYTISTGINDKSIRIQTDNDIPVTVYAFNTYEALADATNLLPVSVLGSDYYHLGRNGTSSERKDIYMVIATQDNTTISENGTAVASLSKGQVYFRQADSYTVDMSGYHITSNHPVAYFTAHNYLNISGGGDNFFQQLTSTNTWGTNFIVPVSKRGVELVRIIASQDGTQITQIGATLPRSDTPAPAAHMLNAGEWVEWEISLANNGCHIQSDKPVQVASYMVGRDYGNDVVTDGDESFVWIPPVEQTVQTALIAPFGSDRLSSHYALIVTPTATRSQTTIKIGAGQTMLLDDQDGTWYDNPTSGMSFYNLQLTDITSSYIFDNQEGLIVYGYGFGWYISYYYMAASSIRQLNPSFYINDIHFQNADGQTYCNNSFEFRGVANMPLSQNPGFAKWYINGVEEVDARDQLLWHKPSLPLGIPQEIKMVLISIDNEEVTTTSTITVIDPHPLEITGDLYICLPATSTTLTAESGPDRYQWYYNGNPILGAIEQTHIVAAADAGEYTVVGQYGTCESPMSEIVTVIDGCLPSLEVTYDGNGHTSGTAPIDTNLYSQGYNVTTQTKGNLARDKAVFLGWSRSAVDLVTSVAEEAQANIIAANTTFVISDNTTLYAVWAIDQTGPGGGSDSIPDYNQFGVIYDGNGSTSGSVVDINRYNSGDQVVLKDKGNLVKTKRVFLGWSRSQESDIDDWDDEKALINSGKLKQPGYGFAIGVEELWYAVWGEDNDGNGVPDYKQAIITYKPGAADGGSNFPRYQAVEKETWVLMTDRGIKIRGYVLIGWFTPNIMPIITTAAVENMIASMPGFKAIGDSLYVTGDITLQAVWARDSNNDGLPDYGGNIIKPSFRNLEGRTGEETGNEGLGGARVWTYGNRLFINTDKAVRVNIYTLSGMLYRQLEAPEGHTSEWMQRGMYIVEIDGSRYKVVVE